MTGKPTLRERYVTVWRELLCGWLGWSGDQFAEFVACYSASLDDRGDPLFYRYDELYYVLSYLVPKSLSRQLSGRKTQAFYYDDLAALKAELGDAIDGRPNSTKWGTPAFDWAAARERVVAVLDQRGCDLPAADDH